MSDFKKYPVTEQKNLYLLGLLMSIVVLVSVMATIFILYRTALTVKLEDLMTLAKSQAGRVERILREGVQKDSEIREVYLDMFHTVNASSSQAGAALSTDQRPVNSERSTTLSFQPESGGSPWDERAEYALDKYLSVRDRAQIVERLHSHFQYLKLPGQNTEVLLASPVNSRILFLFRYRNEFLNPPEPVLFHMNLAEPMQKALSSSSGTMIGLDYQGNQVLAAYMPVDVFNLGLVVKEDLKDFSKPFIHAAIISLGVYLFLILIAGSLFFRLVRPVAYKLASREKEFDELVEEVTEWVWDMDMTGKIAQGSRKSLDLLGYTADEMRGKNLFDMVKPGEVGKIKETFEYSTNFHLNISALECTFMHKNGEEINMELNMLMLTDQKGSMYGYRGIADDISARKSNEYEIRRYQENLEMMVDNRTYELEKVNEELRNFAYIVSHDLRSPLVSIIGFAGELEQDLTLISDCSGVCLPVLDAAQEKEMRDAMEERIPEALYFIKTAAEKMNRLINSILELSRIGRRELVFEDVDIKEIVDETIKSLAFQIEEKQVQVRIGEMPHLNTDRLAMELIFGNLLGNALKYLSPDDGGKINIISRAKGSNVLFIIEDNGCGISAEDVPVIFELFKRVGNQDVVGEGMGLTYVRTIVRRLGGQITCSSKVGEGTRFEFTLPDVPVYS